MSDELRNDEEPASRRLNRRIAEDRAGVERIAGDRKPGVPFCKWPEDDRLSSMPAALKLARRLRQPSHRGVLFEEAKASRTPGRLFRAARANPGPKASTHGAAVIGEDKRRQPATGAETVRAQRVRIYGRTRRWKFIFDA